MRRRKIFAETVARDVVGDLFKEAKNISSKLKLLEEKLKSLEEKQKLKKNKIDMSPQMASSSSSSSPPPPLRTLAIQQL